MSWRAKSSYFSHASSYRENVASARRVLADGVVLLHLHVKNYDSTTINISFFIQQRSISFQNDISQKAVRLGVLQWGREKS